MTAPSDNGNWYAEATCKKWSDSAAWAEGAEPDEVIVVPKNVLTTAGVTRMLNLLIGAGGQAYSENYARIGVGNGTTAETAGDTDLAAAAGGTNRWFRPMDAGFPTVADAVVTFQATWPDGEGNYTWNEWGIDNGGAGTKTAGATVGAPLLNRRVPSTSLGTKTGGTWSLTVTVTIA